MKKKKLIIFIIALIIVVAIVFTLGTYVKKDKIIMRKYDITGIENQFIYAYEEKKIRVLDFVDILSLFGIDKNEIQDSVFMSNIILNEDTKKDLSLIVVINTNKEDYYYDALYSYKESSLLHLDDKELLNLFNNSILKKGKGFVYFIIDSDAKLMEREINTFYK